MAHSAFGVTTDKILGVFFLVEKALEQSPQCNSEFYQHTRNVTIEFIFQKICCFSKDKCNMGLVSFSILLNSMTTLPFQVIFFLYPKQINCRYCYKASNSLKLMTTHPFVPASSSRPWGSQRAWLQQCRSLFQLRSNDRKSS